MKEKDGDRIGIGVIGLGRLGHVHAYNAATRLRGAYLAAVCDMVDSTAGETAAKLGCRAYTEAQEMFADAEVQAAVIATPTAFHVDPVRSAIDAGLPIFCEKPLAGTIEDTILLSEIMEKAGVFCQMGFNRRFDPGYVHAKSRIAGGDIGTPVYFYGVSRDPFPPPPWACNPETGGGLFIDMMLHDFDIARFLMNSEIVEVFAQEANLVVDGKDIPRFADNATVHLRFQSGALGCCHGSMHAEYGYDIHSEVYGAKGSIQIGRVNSDDVTYCTKSAGVSMPATYQWEGDEPHFLYRFRTAYEKELQGFVDSLREKKKPVSDQRDAVAAFRVALAALESAGTGKPVQL